LNDSPEWTTVVEERIDNIEAGTGWENYNVTINQTGDVKIRLLHDGSWLANEPASHIVVDDMTITALSETTVSVSLSSAADTLAVGTYTDTITFTDNTNGTTIERNVKLVIRPEDWYDELAYMPYDTNPDDASFWGHTVTVYGTPTYSAGKMASGAIEFDGVDDYLEYDTSLASDATDLTFMCWARRDVLGATLDMDIAGNYPNYDGEEQGWRLFFDEGGYFKLWMGVTWEKVSVWEMHGATWNVGEWVHVAMTFQYVDGIDNKVKFYVNGEQKLDKTTSYQVSPNSTIPFVVGRRGSGGSYLDGAIDELYLFDRVLDSAEIGELASLCTSQLASDLNNDCKVDMADLAVMGAGWQSTYNIVTLATMAEEWLDCAKYDLSECF
jgi:hypothetical protein